MIPARTASVGDAPSPLRAGAKIPAFFNDHHFSTSLTDTNQQTRKTVNPGEAEGTKDKMRTRL